MILDVNLILKKLSKERKLFHNECDFQFAFADQVRKEYLKYDIRFEYALEGMEQNKRSYIDLVVLDDKECIIFEFKYKTKKERIVDSSTGEIYNLTNQGARDLGVHSIYSDLKRTEDAVLNRKSIFNKPIVQGYCIFMTNDEGYKNGFKKGTYFEKYGFNNDKIISNKKIEFVLPRGSTKEKCITVKNLEEFTFKKEYIIK